MVKKKSRRRRENFTLNIKFRYSFGRTEFYEGAPKALSVKCTDISGRPLEGFQEQHQGGCRVYNGRARDLRQWTSPVDVTAALF